ncbi:MAG TPA: 23S rRNA (adenine(2503)-C(2))-methyltransferase RlmN, partial [Chiayiivirga sp.]|nr:23S rRNA (adenine(2503)-C(2))-methyltransferase RlmN [Chiayiivirga sp.]
NRKYPIEVLMAACERYVLARKRSSVTFEYTLMQGVNDQPQHARELVYLMRQFTRRVQDAHAAKVNLIPFNPFPGTQYQRSSETDIRAFQEILQQNDILAMVRRTRGDDIDAACGQLKGQVVDRGQRQARFRAELAKLEGAGTHALA